MAGLRNAIQVLDLFRVMPSESTSPSLYQQRRTLRSQCLSLARPAVALAFLVLSPPTASAEFILHTPGADKCPSNTSSPTPSECGTEVAQALAARGYQHVGVRFRPFDPEGCMVNLRTSELYYNNLPGPRSGEGHSAASVVCQSSSSSSVASLLCMIGGSVVGFFVLVCCCITCANTEPEDSGGPPAVAIGKAMLRSDSGELAEPLNETAMKSLPKYWTGCRESEDDLGFDNLTYVQHEHTEVFQELVNYTYRQIPTQDRLCPTGKHDKTRGGCPCVQPGGDPGLPTGYQIKRVIRVENSAMFTRYIDRCDRIRTSRSTCKPPDPEIFTHAAMKACSGLTDVLCDVDDSINEVYLWHGTPVRTGLAIAQSDFSLNFAGSGAGTMYGKGLYFSESCTKADEYALNEPRGHYDGVRGLLLCRVCLGNFHYTLDREPSAIDKYVNGKCDSTIGDRTKAANTYREMVVYDRDQVYPEYLVLYERLHRGEPPQLLPKDVPFLLELPLYWRNVSRNPYTESFRQHWFVKPMIRELIQRLANGSYGRDGAAPKVLRARRIEDSVLWCRYIDWKRSLGASVKTKGELQCTPPNQLNGNPESSNTLAATILAEFHGDEAISVENMAPGLNETLLWHGTSQEAADAIAETGFQVKTSGAHGRRFGNGVYLAEDLKKSLSYCTSSCTSNGNVKHVLLCRAVCGDIYYTEESSNHEATSEASKLGKHCVLAHPERSGPREFIVLKPAHVYPEYIVEFQD
ncbi:Parp11 [Symbiodinium sp. CCMP2592]|nr:Parp11 [Symbiodinium sp. CCMP2592]